MAEWDSLTGSFDVERSLEDEAAEEGVSVSDDELPEDTACPCGSHMPCLSPMIICHHPMRRRF